MSEEEEEEEEKKNNFLYKSFKKNLHVNDEICCPMTRQQRHSLTPG